MKKSIVLIFAVAFCMTMHGQSIIENLGSSTAVVVGDPARQASTDVDAVIYNPAGTAVLENGLHLAISGIANIATTDVNSTKSTYKIKENYILPSAQIVYKKDKWAFSGSFASEGGVFRRNYENGSPCIDEMLAGLDVNKIFTETLQSLAKLSGLAADEGLAPALDINPADELRFGQDLHNSHLYNWGIRVGAAYQISDKFSAYAGLKISHVSWHSGMNTKWDVYRPSSNTSIPYSDYMANNMKLIQGMDNETYKQTYTNSLLTVKNFTDKVDDLFANSVDGWGVAPVLGIDYKNEILNFGAKYEFGTHVSVGNGQCVSIPSILSLGGNWQSTNWLKLAVGGDVYFKSECAPLIEYDNKVLWDASASATFTCNKSLELCLGYQLGTLTLKTEDIAYRLTDNMDIVYPSKISAGIRCVLTKNLIANLGVAVHSTCKTTCDFSYGGLGNAGLQSNTSTSNLVYKTTPIQLGVGLNYHF